MLETITHAKKSRFEWIGCTPLKKKNIALLIPQYNEGSNTNLEQRLQYFNSVATKCKDLLDVIIIDDGSTDDSLNQIKKFFYERDAAFYLASVTPNANKVGALHLAVLSLHHEYIILSDFDTDIIGVEKMFRIIESMKHDPHLMGCYFKMLPYEGSGKVFHFQQLEYSVLRCLYRFHRKEGSVPVMPGAGSCYKKSVLLSIYNEHSGQRNGEDREATLLGHKQGYKTFYVDNILTLTRPPLSFRSLIKQRVRWNLGYIETFYKEREHYFSEIKKFSSVGRRTVFDALTIKLTILLPFIIVATFFFSIKLGLVVLSMVYLVGIFLPLNALLLSPRESKGLRDNWILSVLYFPIYKITLDCIAWSKALFKFYKALKQAS